MIPPKKHARRSRRTIGLGFERFEARIVPTTAAAFQNGITTTPTIDANATVSAGGAGQFDASGFPATVIADSDGKIRIGQGDGTGTFQYNHIPATVGGTPISLAVGKFDTGNIDDVAVIDSTNMLSVFLGDGNDGLQTPWTTTVVNTTNSRLNSIALGDFNHDQPTDIAVLANDGSLYIYMNNGSGGFSTTSVTVSPPDIASNDFVVGMTAGTFRPGETGLAVLYSGSSDGAVQVYLGLSSGSSIETASYAIEDFETVDSITAGRFNDSPGGAAVDDIAVHEHAIDDEYQQPTESNIVLLPNQRDGSGTFAPETEGPATSFDDRTQMIAGDFDGDGHSDIAFYTINPLVNPSHGFDVLLGNGDDTFQTIVEVNPGPDHIVESSPVSTGVLVAANFDKDSNGLTDLLEIDKSTTSLYVATTTLPKLSVANITPNEGDPASWSNPGFNYNPQAAFPLQLDTTPLRGSLTVSTQDGTAVSGVDYKAITNQTVHFNQSLSKLYSVGISIWADDFVNPKSRVFSLVISNPIGIDISGVTTPPTASIIDDDSLTVDTVDDSIPVYTGGDEDDFVQAAAIHNNATPSFTTSLRKAIDVADAMNAISTDLSKPITILFDVPDGSTFQLNGALDSITGPTILDSHQKAGTYYTIRGGYIYDEDSGMSFENFDPQHFQSTVNTSVFHQKTSSRSSVFSGFAIEDFDGPAIDVDVNYNPDIYHPPLLPPAGTDDPIRLIGNRIDDIDSGIIVRSGAVIIHNNDIFNTRGFGIALGGSYATVQGNTIRENDEIGIDVFGGEHNSIASNTITKNHVGIEIEAQSRLTILDQDTITDNTLDGILVDPSTNNLGGNREESTAITTIHVGTIKNNGGHGIDVQRPFTAITTGTISGNKLSQILVEPAGNTKLAGITIRGVTVTNPAGNLVEVIKADAPRISDNTISETTGIGLLVENSDGADVAGNTLSDNEVGLELENSSDATVGSFRHGLDALGNTIVGNNTGIWINGQTSQGNVVTNNVVASHTFGVKITSAINNTIGSRQPTLLTFANTISALQGRGVLIEQGATGNYLLGNKIDRSDIGVEINGSTNNSIGHIDQTDAPGYGFGNWITSNTNFGISLKAGANGNFIGGDYVFRNGDANVIVDKSNSNHIFGNKIGADSLIDDQIPVYETKGLVLKDDAESNLIGYATLSSGLNFGNTIHGNGGEGVTIVSGSTRNDISGNKIAKSSIGVDLIGVKGNTIGHFGPNATPGEGFGNTITDSMDIGVMIREGSNANYIGRNLISGNGNSNLTIYGSSANQVYGNWIGTDATGKAPYSKTAGQGIVIRGESTFNRIGGSTSRPGTGLGNVISGNPGDGVLIIEQSDGNRIQGDLIGVDTTARKAISNYNGVEIRNSKSNIVAGPATRFPNVILGNRHKNVLINGVDAGS